jgi:hypothetical protein
LGLCCPNHHAFLPFRFAEEVITEVLSITLSRLRLGYKLFGSTSSKWSYVYITPISRPAIYPWVKKSDDPPSVRAELKSTLGITRTTHDRFKKSKNVQRWPQNSRKTCKMLVEGAKYLANRLPICPMIRSPLSDPINHFPAWYLFLGGQALKTL